MFVCGSLTRFTVVHDKFVLAGLKVTYEQPERPAIDRRCFTYTQTQVDCMFSEYHKEYYNFETFMKTNQSAMYLTSACCRVRGVDHSRVTLY
jgi:hypothetical protein